MKKALVIATALLTPYALAQPPEMSTQPGDDGVYEVAEVQPELVGGLAELQDRLVYPEAARDAGVQGMVVVQFVVGASGEVTAPVVLRAPSPELGDAALTAVRASQFTPGRMGDQPVPVRFALPMAFRLSGDDLESEGGRGSTWSSESSRSIHWDTDYGDLESLVDYRATSTTGLDAMVLSRVTHDSEPFPDLEVGSAVVRFRVSSRGRAEQIEVSDATSPVVGRFARFRALTTRFEDGAIGQSGSMTVTVESVRR